MPPIEINYMNPAKPQGVVGGPITVPLNSRFSFFSHDGSVHIEFIESAPFPGGLGASGGPPPRFPGDHEFHALIPGLHKFKCFLHSQSGQEIELDPSNNGGVGGELTVGGLA